MTNRKQIQITMRPLKITQIDRYKNFLHDVYEGERCTTTLCRKHRISTNTAMVLKKMSLVDIKGYSKMSRKPNSRTAQQVIDNNKGINKNYAHNARQSQIQFTSKKQDKKPVQHQQEKPVSKRTEISLFWGMIKIKN